MMKPWYSYKGKKYEGDCPPYYDLSGLAWYVRLMQELPQVQEQIQKFLSEGELDIKEYFNKAMVEGKRWEAVSFLFWKHRNEAMIAKVGTFFDAINYIPGLVSFSVSILQPHTRIKGHYGDTDAIYRMHIPIYIPKGLPECGFSVAGITRPWTDDDIIVFCDAHFHEAWNLSDEPRAILIMDVMREAFLPSENEVCANVLSFLKYQAFSAKNPYVRKLPGWAKDLTRRILKRVYPLRWIAP